MVQIEKEIVVDVATWVELSSVSERMADNCGLIAANLELALDARNPKPTRVAHLANALHTSNRGLFLAKKFLALWKIAEEQGATIARREVPE